MLECKLLAKFNIYCTREEKYYDFESKFNIYCTREEKYYDFESRKYEIIIEMVNNMLKRSC